MAEEFLIQRRPERSGASGRGHIEFDTTRQRFVIVLGGALERGRGAVETVALVRFERFVYAHEFAHRFFFVRVGDGWSRALAEVVEASSGAERFKIARSVPGIEEKICNNIATRLLVPREHLDRAIRETMSTETNTRHLLVNILRNVSRRFEVSWWCAARRIAAVRTPELKAAWGPSYCYLLLGRSVHTGAGRGKSRLRVLDFWWPEEVAGEPIKPAFPGLGLSHLGEEFAERASSLEETRQMETETKICWPMRLVSKERRAVEAVLRGYCRRWNLTVEGRYLVYGEVSPARR